MNPILARIIDDLKREPSRTGSLVITIFGDAIVPRGGTVWLGTLLDFFATLDIDGGSVRTAMSRLASDGWLERRKIGRNSFYRLAEKGRDTFDAAMRHVYNPPPAGPLELLLLTDGTRAVAKSALQAAGFGSPLPGVWLAPAGVKTPAAAGNATRVAIQSSDADTRNLVAAGWPLKRMAAAYQAFMTTFEPLRRPATAAATLSDLDAFTARILLVNGYRRVTLRDPLLSKNLMPTDWPGTMARRLCRDIYGALLPASERWLDAHGLDEDGPLSAADPSLSGRFGD